MFYVTKIIFISVFSFKDPLKCNINIGLSESVWKFKMTILSDILPIASKEQRYMLWIVWFEVGAKPPLTLKVKMFNIITCSGGPFGISWSHPLPLPLPLAQSKKKYIYRGSPLIPPPRRHPPTPCTEYYFFLPPFFYRGPPTIPPPCRRPPYPLHRVFFFGGHIEFWSQCKKRGGGKGGRREGGEQLGFLCGLEVQEIIAQSL